MISQILEYTQLNNVTFLTTKRVPVRKNKNYPQMLMMQM